jgi:hypothetical protein
MHVLAVAVVFHAPRDHIVGVCRGAIRGIDMGTGVRLLRLRSE